MSSVHEHIKVWTVLDLIRWGASYFQEKGVESGRLTMELLLCNVLQCTRIALYSDFERPLSATDLATLRTYVQRVAHHEPLQYVLGETEFYSLKFEVNPDVLIPRPETEFLVEAATAVTRGRTTCLDIGTGSGAIPITILKHAPHTRWVCVDKSTRALEVARRNAERHGVTDHCVFEHMDILTQAPSQTFDIICMNPPYIPAKEVAELDQTVRDYEPHTALTDDADGLTFYKRMVELAPVLLSPSGVLFMELGWGLAETVECMYRDSWQTKVITDLNDIPRVLQVQAYQHP